MIRGLFGAARVVGFHHDAVTHSRQPHEILQRVEFVILVLEAVRVGRIGIGNECLRRLAVDLENDGLGLAPAPDASTAAVTVNAPPLQL